MSLLFALFSLFASPVHAGQGPLARVPSPWTEVVSPGIYYLTGDLKVNDRVQFPESAKFDFVEVMGGGGYVPVTIFELQAKVCPDAEATEDIFLINPTGRKGEEVGVELRKNCHIIFYVEDNMVGLPSVFTDSTE